MSDDTVNLKDMFTDMPDDFILLPPDDINPLPTLIRLGVICSVEPVAVHTPEGMRYRIQLVSAYRVMMNRGWYASTEELDAVLSNWHKKLELF